MVNNITDYIKIYGGYGFYIIAFLLLILLFIMPVFLGLIGVVFPSFNYFPALDGNHFSSNIWFEFFKTPHLFKIVITTFSIGFFATLVAFCISSFLIASFHIFYLNSINSNKESHKIWNRLTSFLSIFLSIPHVAFSIGFLFLIIPFWVYFKNIIT